MAIPFTTAGGSSGDLIADRRYGWGEAAMRDGDFAAAADLFAQTAEVAPAWAPAWMALGEALRKQGDHAAARQAFDRANALDPSGALGAGLRLAALGAASPATAPAAYVRDLFDQYAPRFDAHLTGALGYRAPELLRAAVERLGPRRFALMLDLGCGTGLAAREFAPLVGGIAGVDLSPAMLARARQTGLYESLEADDLVSWLEARAPGAAGLAVAADVFVYMGDLAPAFLACARALETGGLFALTTQLADDGDWRVGGDLRYSHSPAYLRRVAAEAGFSVAHLEAASTRRDMGEDVPGLLCVLQRN